VERVKREASGGGRVGAEEQIVLARKALDDNGDQLRFFGADV
jgi:hypothetical protein